MSWRLDSDSLAFVGVPLVGGLLVTLSEMSYFTLLLEVVKAWFMYSYEIARGVYGGLGQGFLLPYLIVRSRIWSLGTKLVWRAIAFILACRLLTFIFSSYLGCLLSL